MSNEIAKISNPMGEVQKVSTAMAQASSNREMQEVQAMMVIAQQFPRNNVQAMDNVLNACMRPKLAQNALYSYAKGGTDISGPSIRMAEAIAGAWGNVSYGIKELNQANGESEVLAYAWDVQTNTRVEKVFTVKHWRHTRSGGYALSDPREIYELIANNGARRLRACILAVIPSDVIESAVEQCEKTMHATADITTESIKKMVEAFAKKKVTKTQIEKRIQRRMDSITPAQFVQLRKIYKSIEDGMSSPDDWFDSEKEIELPSE